MFAALRYITLIPRLVAIVQAAVAFVEGVKAHDPGTEKKAAVLEALESGWEGIGKEFQINVPYTVLKDVISFLVDFAVSIYNLVGYFKKKDAPAS